MNRRKYLATLGTLAGGSAGVMGTGAFTSVSAERAVTVNVAADANAFLGLRPCDGPNGNYVTGASDGAMAIDLSKSNGNLTGEGVNPEALSVFDNVFQIANQGTQDVCIDFEVDVPKIPSDANVPDRYDFGAGDPAVVFYRGASRDEYVINNRLDTDRDGAIKLPIDNGNAECIGFEVRAFGFDSGTDLFDGVDMTIRADANANCGAAGEDPADPTPTNPVGYWPLDELSDGTTPNVAGTTDGSWEGDTNNPINGGAVGKAFEFGGEHGYIQIDDDPSLELTSVTIAAWVKRSGSKKHEYIFDGRGHNYYMKEDDGTEKPRFGVTVDGDRKVVIAADPLPEGEWTHVAGTYSEYVEQDALKLYIDGEERKTKDVSGDAIDTGQSGTGIWESRIGDSVWEIENSDNSTNESDNQGNRQYLFQGQIDEVRVYDRALSQGEVQALFDESS
ncbi:LamG domain-containing protein [Halanaeroarchaeum sulfurireducens]|uniref:LamG-like jellyroll fold domain-containing protein n=1 Tax=Halanaeroarchaeum sulfurireducens TaxID=1604004 RepID=A0A0F7P603_9EURY|nr:LamG domain-containing protein [Halanaeroarchaeum sulfurireducens]AKH96611.1 hypothetical protein HLASF_0097 [Halanaeroarchaeum sulfurireducens]ALG81013.1 hypothetical protein HLASA_0097 [Halanaeroarchaeum sulfurireducens]